MGFFAKLRMTRIFCHPEFISGSINIDSGSKAGMTVNNNKKGAAEIRQPLTY
jgi:hypothetical protein